MHIAETKNITSALINAPIKKTLFVNGGSGATGNPCEPMHHRQLPTTSANAVGGGL
jgi:hypothetical protein